MAEINMQTVNILERLVQYANHRHSQLEAQVREAELLLETVEDDDLMTLIRRTGDLKELQGRMSEIGMLYQTVTRMCEHLKSKL